MNSATGSLPGPLDRLEALLRRYIETHERIGDEHDRVSGLRFALHLLDEVRQERAEIEAEHEPGRVYVPAEPEVIRDECGRVVEIHDGEMRVYSSDFADRNSTTDFLADDRPEPRYEEDA